MTLILGFLSRDGVLFAAQADTAVAAIDDLAKQFGEEVADAFDIAREEIAGTVLEMVSERGAADPRPPAAGTADPVGVDADSHDAGGAPAAPPAPEAETPAEAPTADEEPTAGAGDSGPEVPPVDGGGVDEGPRCVVGDEPVPPGLAEVSVMRFGDVRCKQHATW